MQGLVERTGTGQETETVEGTAKNLIPCPGTSLSPDPGASPGTSPCPSAVTSLGAFKALLTQRASQNTHWTLSERVAVEVAYTLCQNKYIRHRAILLASDHPRQTMVGHRIKQPPYQRTFSTHSNNLIIIPPLPTLQPHPLKPPLSTHPPTPQQSMSTEANGPLTRSYKLFMSDSLMKDRRQGLELRSETGQGLVPGQGLAPGQGLGQAISPPFSLRHHLPLNLPPPPLNGHQHQPPAAQPTTLALVEAMSIPVPPFPSSPSLPLPPSFPSSPSLTLAFPSSAPFPSSPSLPLVSSPLNSRLPTLSHVVSPLLILIVSIDVF